MLSGNYVEDGDKYAKILSTAHATNIEPQPISKLKQDVKGRPAKRKKISCLEQALEDAFNEWIMHYLIIYINNSAWHRIFTLFIITQLELIAH